MNGYRPNRAEMELNFEIAQFFAYEGDILDQRQYDAWLDILSDDLRYWMPLVRNVPLRDREHEYSREQKDLAWFDEDKASIAGRVAQLKSGIHWAEEPRSRVSRLVTNTRIESSNLDSNGNGTLTTTSRFIVYQNRVRDEINLFVGKRRDTLNRDGGSYRLGRREIYLDQNVMLAKALTVFF